MTRIDEYIRYHEHSTRVGDVDPSHGMLRYICDFLDLGDEQRYWLAFVYALTYCGASVYYVHSELPSFQDLNKEDLNDWWYDRGRAAIICQTDARWRRSRNQFVDAIESYRTWIGGRLQAMHFAATATGDTPEKRYDGLYFRAGSLYTFGRFTLFNYLEALHTLTPLDLQPTDLDLSQAWSCRDGLLYAYGLDQWIRDEPVPTPVGAKEVVADTWADLRSRLNRLEIPPNVWQIETALCAYRKYRRTIDGLASPTGRRWIGYYLDRQADEIAKMEDHVPDLDWKMLWRYREETYPHEFLAEKHGWVTPKGIGKGWKEFGIKRTEELVS